MKRLGLSKLVTLARLMDAHWKRWDYARQSPLHPLLPAVIGRIASLELAL